MSARRAVLTESGSESEIVLVYVLVCMAVIVIVSAQATTPAWRMTTIVSGGNYAGAAGGAGGGGGGAGSQAVAPILVVFPNRGWQLHAFQSLSH